MQGSTCVADHLKSKQNIDREKLNSTIQKICIKILTYFREIKEGDEKLAELYENKVVMKNQEVKIYDWALKNVLHTGKFLGVNREGNAKLLTEEGKQMIIYDDRMRSQ